ncbi:hypothetical protein [Burkholderia lata]|uniref:hypothetical protein n=1 Tax=Burkholderia lata (strain ATCC 17760 / DSM 23089 / LMG 22485 / NCIMB 9086 / R18194 / 383) TaxID=482957 RepID=UPI001581D4E2|nr:hypothetical protein [Burkholderia lata]
MQSLSPTLTIASHDFVPKCDADSAGCDWMQGFYVSGFLRISQKNYRKLHWYFSVFRVERVLIAWMECLNVVRPPDRGGRGGRFDLMREEMVFFAADNGFI